MFMSQFENKNFEMFWKKTEIIREYCRILYTFGDMKLPYIFLAEHGTIADRTIIMRGIVNICKPQILLPGSRRGLEFKSGFENADSIPDNAIFMLRAMGLPFSEVNQQIISTTELEYGSLSQIIERFEKELDAKDDSETGLIKGVMGGAEVSLMRYSLGLMIKSAGPNAKEFFDHLRRGRGEPIGLNENITDEDIDKLFG
jgi:hypothetical protein